MKQFVVAGRKFVGVFAPREMIRANDSGDGVEALLRGGALQQQSCSFRAFFDADFGVGAAFFDGAERHAFPLWKAWKGGKGGKLV